MNGFRLQSLGKKLLWQTLFCVNRWAVINYVIFLIKLQCEGSLDFLGCVQDITGCVLYVTGCRESILFAS